MKIRVMFLLLAATLVACEKDLDRTNPNSPRPDAYYQTGPQLLEGVNAIYAALQGPDLFAREYYYLHDLRSDECASGGGQLELARQQVLGGNLDANNSINLAVWRGLYRVIFRANLVISKAPGALTNITTAQRKQYVAEAQFLRGWAYFELVSLYGKVPIYTTYLSGEPAPAPRSQSEEEVYTQVLTDLTEAAAELPATYLTSDQGRATKWAALTMLGRAYMQKGDLANAKLSLEKVKTQFSLVDRFEDNSQEEAEFNKESIFEVYFSEVQGTSFAFSPGGGTALTENTIMGQERAPIAWRNYIPSNKLLLEYESTTRGDAKTDPRYAFTFYEVGDKYNFQSAASSTITAREVSGNTNLTVNGVAQRVSWKKYTTIYKRASENFSSGINVRVMRYAEVLLLLAEIENEQGNTAGALAYLNQLRARPTVLMPTYPTAKYPCNSKDETFKAIAHEKLVELAGEQIRNRDLLRWRKAGKVGVGKLLGEPLPNVPANRRELLPIPQSEVDNNEQISPADQNPGY